MIEEKVIESILLPLDSNWEVSRLIVDEQGECVHVHLRYLKDTVEVDGLAYPVFDYRKKRSWRHLDFWHYKTYLHASMPRYKDSGSYKTAPVPWAESLERMTYLLEKKR